MDGLERRDIRSIGASRILRPKGEITLKMLIVFMLGCLMAGTAQAVEPAAVREQLAASKNVKNLLVIDEFHTWVLADTTGFTGNITQEFYNELYDLCSGAGGKFEQKNASKDSITGQTSESWGEAPRDKYRITLESPMKLRCNGVFNFAYVYKPILLNQRGEDIGRVTNFTMKHATPQPFVYKAETLPPLSKVEKLEDGDIYASLKDRIKAGDGGWFGISSIRGVAADVDIFEYLSALCFRGEGRLRFVTREADLIERNAVNAFSYINKGVFSLRTGPVFEWYAACEGNNRFVAKLVHEYDARRNYQAKGVYASNRGLEGLKFIGASGSSAPAVAEGTAVQPAQQVKAVSSGDPVQDQLALDISIRGGNMVVSSANQEYSGLYNGRNARGCDIVAVVKKWVGARPNSRTDLTNYTVCSGVIARISDTPREPITGIDESIRKVAGMASKYGTGDGNYQGYAIRGTALRDKNNCDVEVKVMKNDALYLHRVVNGCM